MSVNRKTNMTGLREELLESFEKFVNGQLDYKGLMAISSISGKIQSTAKLQLSYSLARKEKPEIEFMK